MVELTQNAINSLFSRFPDIPILVDTVRSDSIYGKFCKPHIVMYRAWCPDVTQTMFEFIFKMRVNMQCDDSTTQSIGIEFSEHFPYFRIKDMISYYPADFDHAIMKKMSEVIGQFPMVDKISFEVNKDPVCVGVDYGR